MTVDDHVRPAFVSSPLGKNDRMEFGLHHVDRKAEGAQQSGDKFLRAFHSLPIF